ncbi:hypothetical protein JB92DRAFT_3267475 [Gautieria morchelliformis]|nr:hypothetical protein JB92DRAFT_3267475 [Gautieria morchelliformis]
MSMPPKGFTHRPSPRRDLRPTHTPYPFEANINCFSDRHAPSNTQPVPQRHTQPIHNSAPSPRPSHRTPHRTSNPMSHPQAPKLAITRPSSPHVSCRPHTLCRHPHCTRSARRALYHPAPPHWPTSFMTVTFVDRHDTRRALSNALRDIPAHLNLIN